MATIHPVAIHSWLSVRFFLFFVTWSVFLSFWGIWLTGRGFSAGNVGLIITTGLIGRSVGVALIYPVLSQHVSSLTLARTLPWVSAVLATMYLPAGGLAQLLTVSAVFGLAYPMLLPLHETIATVNAGTTGRTSYGHMRAYGSAGFIVGTAVAGAANQVFGSAALLRVFLLGLVLLGVSGALPVTTATATAPEGVPLPPTAPAPEGVPLVSAAPAASAWRALAANHGYVLSLASAVLLQGAHGAYYAYGAIMLRGMGLSPVAVALTLVIAPLSELLLFRFASRFVSKLGVAGLYLLATVASVIRWSCLALVANPIVFAVAQLLHAGTYGLTQLAFTHTVQNHVRSADTSAAQGAYAALAMGLGLGALTEVAGYLYEISPRLAFAVMALLCLPCLLLQRGLARALTAPPQPQPCA